MSKKSLVSFAGAAVMTFLPLLSYAQSTGNTAPLGSKENPIKPSSVNTAPPNGKPSAKGKRGSKSNPIAGSVHPRGTSAN